MCASLNEARTAEPWPEVRKWTLRRLRSIRNSREINLDKIVGAAAGSRRAAFQLQVNASPGHDIIDLRFCTGDRKRVVSGKRLSVRVNLGGRRIIKKKKKEK